MTFATAWLHISGTIVVPLRNFTHVSSSADTVPQSMKHFIPIFSTCADAKPASGLILWSCFWGAQHLAAGLVQSLRSPTIASSELGLSVRQLLPLQVPTSQTVAEHFDTLLKQSRTIAVSSVSFSSDDLVWEPHQKAEDFARRFPPSIFFIQLSCTFASFLWHFPFSYLVLALTESFKRCVFWKFASHLF